MKMYTEYVTDVDAECWRLAADMLGGAGRAATWFQTKNVLLHDQTPAELIARGKGAKILNLLEGKWLLGEERQVVRGTWENRAKNLANEVARLKDRVSELEDAVNVEPRPYCVYGPWVGLDDKPVLVVSGDFLPPFDLPKGKDTKFAPQVGERMKVPIPEEHKHAGDKRRLAEVVVTSVAQPCKESGYVGRINVTFPTEEQITKKVRVCGLTYCSDGNAGGHSGYTMSTCQRPFDHEGPAGDVPGTKCGRS